VIKKRCDGQNKTKQNTEATPHATIQNKMSTTLTPDSITSQYIFILLLLLLIGALTLTFLHFSPTSRSQKKQKGKTLLLAQPSAGKTQLAILLTTQSAKIKEKIPTITTVEDTFYEPRYWDTKAYSTLEKFRRAHPKEVLQNIVVIVHPTATDAIKCVAEILYDVLMQNRSSKLPILIVAHGHKGTRRKIEAEL